MLISPPVTARRYGVLPFAVAAGRSTWAWFALHARRLRDAGRPTGPALGIAILYALAIVLLMLLIEPIVGPTAGAAATDGAERLIRSTYGCSCCCWPPLPLRRAASSIIWPWSSWPLILRADRDRDRLLDLGREAAERSGGCRRTPMS